MAAKTTGPCMVLIRPTQAQEKAGLHRSRFIRYYSNASFGKDRTAWVLD
jgi:hypothetical protein